METMMNTPLYLPHELIIQILMRLPVKSLIRFKCVCKLWLTLISDPYFANSHFELTAATHTHRIMFISTSPPYQTQSIDYEASLRSASASPSLNFLLPQTHPDIEIIGSCRGFILLHCSSEFHIWNPSTGVHKEIPLSPNDSHLDVKYLCYLYGFAYDQSRDDYLVFSMSYDTTLANDNISSHLEFFSLRDNTWKEIEGTHLPYMHNSDLLRVGSLFNGVIHWLAFRNDTSMDVIVAFDLKEWKVLDIHLPDEFEGELDDSGLWVFGEFLSLWATDHFDRKGTVEIWVMKEYKVHSSWIKTHVVSLDDIHILIHSPLCSTKSGDIIGADDGKVVKYNDKGQWLESYCYFNDRGGSEVALYVESLLSLPADNEQA
ncbi:unnamed protein product [Trifolium pratense]|uniref:Uncharacterized protein n=1 Tax=Trifolium pratense TaxID=57577 RepID=A0ACB0IUJ1_TRIPR|nr:unnamed protein product [Trifolium pratense]